MKRLVVVGGTGSLGRAVVEKARAAGHEAVAASRTGAVVVDVQPIDVREVADVLVAAIDAGPSKRLPDVGGPEIVPFIDLVRAWRAAAQVRKLLLHLPVPGKLGAFLRSGRMCTPDHKVGKRTFAEWLAVTYPPSPS